MRRIDSIKSCGNRHSYCGECRPDVVARKNRPCAVGCTCRRHELSEEHRAKISASLAGNTNTLGHKQSEVTCAKRGEALRGNTNSLGYRHTAAAKAQISAASLGRTHNRGGKRSAAVRAKMSAAQRRRGAVSEEGRKRMSIAQRKHVAECDGSECRRVSCTPPRSPTRIENILHDVLLAEFPIVERERRFGRYRVDAYLPEPYHLAFEADGSYWHGSARMIVRDLERDAYLLAEHSLPVVRLGEAELMAMAVT